MIPYGKQNISREDVDAVVRVLQSDFITQGPVLPRFEEAIAHRCGAVHCVAVNNATSALHISLLSLGVGPGDQVWTVPITFVATANAVLHCGADVDFVDICPDTFNMDIGGLERKLAQARADGAPLPKVVVPVHLTGRSCDMAAIADLSGKYGFRVLEDASHAIGGHYDGKPIGACAHSDLCVFSFHPVKIMTTGEGGAITTNDPGLARKLSVLRSHGITRDPQEMERHDGPWHYEQHCLGYNYRMTEMQAALGLSQLTRLDRFVAQRRQLAGRYDVRLEGSRYLLPSGDTPAFGSSWHLYVVRLPRGSPPLERLHLVEKLRSGGIGVNVHYIPVYRHPHYRRMGFSAADFPASESYYDRAVSLPLFYDMTERQQDEVVACLLEPQGFQTIF